MPTVGIKPTTSALRVRFRVVLKVKMRILTPIMNAVNLIIANFYSASAHVTAHKNTFFSLFYFVYIFLF